uniref:Nicolin 1 n=1 Tax=Malurus cyaneus samueli TaxID=2593467 RepID=A0A8C5UCV4_9PASS
LVRVWGACRSRNGTGIGGARRSTGGRMAASISVGMPVPLWRNAVLGLRPLVPQVQEIVFRNFYTAFLSVRVQRPGPGGSRRWVTCLRDLCLMPCPHTEEGSQDYFCLRRHQMLCDMDQVTAMRFILRQPSPVWLHFTIEDLQIFPPGQKSPQKDFPSWLSQLTPPEQPASLHGELPDPEKVSTEVQQMWVLTEVIRARQAAARIGRFDVDGCYDVNLLSYT